MVLGECNQTDDILSRAAPYLYPCSVEYGLLAMTVLALLLSGLDDSQYLPPTGRPTEINCHKTHKGLFFGIVTLAGTCVSIILFFSYLEVSSPQMDTSTLIFQVTDLVLHVVLLLGVVVAWAQITKLSFMPQAEYCLKDFVLLASLFGTVFFNFLQVIPTVRAIISGPATVTGILSVARCLAGLCASLLQAGFLLDLSSRYLSMDEEWEQKPGRHAVTFLLFLNISLWLVRSFHFKQLGVQSWDPETLSYGALAWQLAVHALVPVLAFHYLYCSAWLARLWHDLYTKPRSPGKTADHHPHLTSSPSLGDMESVRHRKQRQPSDHINVDDIMSPVSDV